MKIHSPRAILNFAALPRRKIRAPSTLTADRLREILHYDPEVGVFTSRRDGTPVGAWLGKGYWGIRIDGRTYPAHRLAWLWMTDSWPKDEMDHKNLREATSSQNGMNVPLSENNWTGVKGVYVLKTPGCRPVWGVNVYANGKRYHRRCNGTLGEAAEIRARLAAKHHGEFMRLQ